MRRGRAHGPAAVVSRTSVDPDGGQRLANPRKTTRPATASGRGVGNQAGIHPLSSELRALSSGNHRHYQPTVARHTAGCRRACSSSAPRACRCASAPGTSWCRRPTFAATVNVARAIMSLPSALDVVFLEAREARATAASRRSRTPAAARPSPPGSSDGSARTTRRSPRARLTTPCPWPPSRATNPVPYSFPAITSSGVPFDCVSIATS